jgi:hypothetical protein
MSRFVTRGQDTSHINQTFYLQALDFQRDYLINDASAAEFLPIKAIKADLLTWTIMPATHLGYVMFWSGTCSIFALGLLAAIFKKI